MKKRAWFSLIVVTLLLVAIPLSQAWGDGRRHGGHGPGFHGRGFHGRAFIVGSPFWWGAPYPYYYPYWYPYPVYAPAPAAVIVEPAPIYVSEQPAVPESYWYYCGSAKAYYPSVPMCAEAWIKVPPRSE